MEDNKQISAKEFIDQQYDKFFGDRDKSTFPETLMDDFDMKAFARNVLSRDLYEIFMRSDPAKEFDAFYNCLGTNKEVKLFSLERSKALCDKYDKVNKTIEECSRELRKMVKPIGEPKDSTELDIVSCIEILYDTEIRRIIYLMKKFIERAKEIISSIDSIGNDELDIKQVKLLILLDDMKDTSKVEPETLVAGALDIYRQLQVNVLDENVVNKLCDACA